MAVWQAYGHGEEFSWYPDSAHVDGYVELVEDAFIPQPQDTEEWMGTGCCYDSSWAPSAHPDLYMNTDGFAGDWCPMTHADGYVASESWAQSSLESQADGYVASEIMHHEQYIDLKKLPEDICWDWAKGTCPRGSSCPWRHGFNETLESTMCEEVTDGPYDGDRVNEFVPTADPEVQDKRRIGKGGKSGAKSGKGKGGKDLKGSSIRHKEAPMRDRPSPIQRPPPGFESVRASASSGREQDIGPRNQERTSKLNARSKEAEFAVPHEAFISDQLPIPSWADEEISHNDKKLLAKTTGLPVWSIKTDSQPKAKQPGLRMFQRATASLS